MLIRKILLFCFILFILPLSLFSQLQHQQGVKSGQIEEPSVNSAIVPLPKIEDDFYDWFRRHKKIKRMIAKESYELLFIGDSITHMFGGEPKSTIARGKGVWKDFYGSRKVINIGFGWDRIQNVLWRLDNGEWENLFPKVAVIMIGTNNLTGTTKANTNSPDEIVEGILKICSVIHQKSPDTQILLLGILPRRPVYLMESINIINKTLPTLVDNSYISFCDMGDSFTDSEGLAEESLFVDGVHPTAAGYQIWAEQIEPYLKKWLD